MRITSTARVATERPERYGKQLASHLGAKLTAHWDADTQRGTVQFINEDDETYAHVEMIASEDTLLLQAQSTEESIDLVEDVMGRHLVRFGAREELVVKWNRTGGGEGTQQGGADATPTEG